MNLATSFSGRSWTNSRVTICGQRKVWQSMFSEKCSSPLKQSTKKFHSYDFSASPGVASTDPDDDLFSNAARIRPDQNNRRRLIVFDMEDAPIGSFVKWVLLN